MIKYCLKCNEYTLMAECPKCKAGTVAKKPAKFSPLKDYSAQRLKTRGYL